jgi:hypothetical protein
MSDGIDKEQRPPEPPGMEEENKSPDNLREGSGEIKLREIPGLEELEARRKYGKKKSSSTTVFTLILVILFGFTVVVYLMNKYREEHILISAAEGTGTAVETGQSSTQAIPPTNRPDAGSQTSPVRKPPDKIALAREALTGEAVLKVRAKGPLISDEKDPEIAAVGEALRSRVELLNGIKRSRASRGGDAVETAAGVFQGFRINSTRVKTGDKITKDEIIVTTPSKGIFVIRGNILDAWRKCNYDTISRDLENSGIEILKEVDLQKGIVKVQLRVSDPEGASIKRDFLISDQNVGRVELGMTIQQMKSVYPENYGYVRKRIEHENDFFFVIKVFNEKDNPLFFVNEKDNKVWGIQIINSKYKTRKGIGIGSTLGRLKVYYRNPRIWTAKGSAPLVSVGEIVGVFILENKGIDFDRKIFPNEVKITSILIGNSPYLN